MERFRVWLSWQVESFGMWLSERLLHLSDRIYPEDALDYEPWGFSGVLMAELDEREAETVEPLPGREPHRVLTPSEPWQTDIGGL